MLHFTPPRFEGEAQSARNPTLLFEFVRLLFQFEFQTPAFELLFQFAHDSRHICRLPNSRPFIFVSKLFDPTAYQPSDFIDLFRDCI